ncbi:restriction endonuclease subunit S [Methanolobus sp. WCC5]|uniref:restriction endonuclease subunit S n=1 Tax=Methanolobus sp. WCC5 TaxID=3125785 RepID=UPI0032561A12
MGKEKLPEGWKILPIGKCVADDLSGFACSQNKLVEEGGYVQLRPFNIENGKLNLDTLYQVPLDIVDENKYYLEKGDILFNNTNSTELVGKSAIANERYSFAFSNHINRIRLDTDVVLPQFFHSYLSYMWAKGHFAKHCKKWIGQSGYTLTSLKNQPILIPPIDVQQEIITKLEKQIAEIENIKKEITIQELKINQIFEGYLSSVFKDLKDFSLEKKIKDFCENPQYGYTVPASKEKIGPKLLRITDIQNNHVNWDTVPYCNCPSEKYSQYELKNNDIVFARTGATTGKSFLIKNPENSVFASYLIRLKIKDENVLPEYLYLFFKSPSYWNQILKHSRGGTMPNFNATMLGNLKVPIIDISMQHKIINHSNGVYELYKQLADINSLQSIAVNQLPESILNEVFSKYEIPEKV